MVVGVRGNDSTELCGWSPLRVSVISFFHYVHLPKLTQTEGGLSSAPFLLAEVVGHCSSRATLTNTHPLPQIKILTVNTHQIGL